MMKVFCTKMEIQIQNSILCRNYNVVSKLVMQKQLQTLLPNFTPPDFTPQTSHPRLYSPDFTPQTLLPMDSPCQTLHPRLYSLTLLPRLSLPDFTP